MLPCSTSSADIFPHEYLRDTLPPCVRHAQFLKRGSFEFASQCSAITLFAACNIVCPAFICNTNFLRLHAVLSKLDDMHGTLFHLWCATKGTDAPFSVSMAYERAHFYASGLEAICNSYGNSCMADNSHLHVDNLLPVSECMIENSLDYSCMSDNSSDSHSFINDLHGKRPGLH